MTNREAIEKLVNARFADEFQGDQELTEAMHMALDALNATQYGRWREMLAKRDSDGCIIRDYMCTVCENMYVDVPDSDELELYRYCPFCGARMIVGDD